ncbi:MAG: hypothetical protein GX275_13130 [Clostridiales bacterium]|nr:hypothetical protein [Clostridiales bacterium]
MKNQFKRETASLGVIDRIIIFLTIVVVIITISMSFITYKNMKDRVIEIYEGNLSNRTDERIEAINSFFDNKFENLKFLALQPEVYSMNWNTQRNYLLGKSKRLGFEHIFIMDNEGIGYYVETNVIKNQSSEEFSKLVLSNEKYISEPFMEYTQNRSIVTMTYSITDKDGNKLGSICGAVNLTEINKKIEEFVLGGKWLWYCYKQKW